MKQFCNNIILVATVFLFFTDFFSYGQSNINKDPSDYECLRYTCKITTKNELKNPVEVVLFLNNKIIDHKVIDTKNKFEYSLKSDSYYIIQVSTPFYITRYIVINTNIPDKVKKEKSDFFVHEMELELLEQPKVYYPPNVDSDILDEPITIIRYITQDANFGIDPKYTNKIKRELRMFKKNVDMLQTDQFPKN